MSTDEPLAPLAALAGRQCLVTGGLGFIGANVARALADAGATVTVVDALVPQHGGDRRNLEDRPGIEVVVADLGDRERVAPLVARAEVVFNVAGQVSHLESMADPLRDLDLNVRSHLAFLEILRAERPDARVVHTSTRQVYGRPQYLPVDEDHPTVPVDVNGIDKLACEQLHLLYASVHGLTISALRLTNVYGPRQSLEREGLGFLPVFLRRALEGGTIRVYGDGRQQRDCLFVDDVVAALVTCATSHDTAGQVFNLGHPEPLALVDIAEVIVAAAGQGSIELVAWPDQHAAIDIGSFSGDYSKVKRVLGWEPLVSFADGIAATIDFYRRHPWYRSST